MNSLVVFIMAGGANKFFPGGLNKQMLVIDGKPLIERTVELVRSMWNVEPYVIVNGGQPFGPEMRYFYPTDNRFIIDALQSTSGAWGHTNIVLLGDVYYTEKALTAIRTGNEFAYGKTHEIFGVKFQRGEIVRLMRAIAVARRDATQNGGHGRFWNMYRAWEGIPVQEHKIGPGYYLFTDDEKTQDFDRVEQYQQFIRRRVTA